MVIDKLYIHVINLERDKHHLNAPVIIPISEYNKRRITAEVAQIGYILRSM